MLFSVNEKMLCASKVRTAFFLCHFFLQSLNPVFMLIHFLNQYADSLTRQLTSIDFMLHGI